jgi:uncharacterized cupin superfamily protein
MARPGDIIEHPLTRERLTFLETSAQTGGSSVRYQLEVAPGGFATAPHVHPWIEERFEIISGEWLFVIEGVEQRLSPGDSALIPARQAHSWRNGGDEIGVAIVECRLTNPQRGTRGESSHSAIAIRQSQVANALGVTPFSAPGTSRSGIGRPAKRR